MYYQSPLCQEFLIGPLYYQSSALSQLFRFPQMHSMHRCYLSCQYYYLLLLHCLFCLFPQCLYTKLYKPLLLFHLKYYAEVHLMNLMFLYLVCPLYFQVCHLQIHYAEIHLYFDSLNPLLSQLLSVPLFLKCSLL